LAVIDCSSLWFLRLELGYKLEPPTPNSRSHTTAINHPQIGAAYRIILTIMTVTMCLVLMD